MHVEDIIFHMFQYIQKLRTEGPQEWVFEECKVFNVYSVTLFQTEGHNNVDLRTYFCLVVNKLIDPGVILISEANKLKIVYIFRHPLHLINPPSLCLQDLNKVAFRFKDKERPRGYTSKVAGLLHVGPLSIDKARY